MNLEILGYVPVNKFGRAIVDPRRYKIYYTYNMAKQWSPVDQAEPVYIEKHVLPERKR